MLLRLSFVLSCLVALVSAQSGEEETERLRAKREAAGEAVEEGGDLKSEHGKKNPDEAEGLEKLTPEQRLARNIRHGASNFCSFVVNPKPAKLMPGQSGMLVVTAILKGPAVLPSPAPLEITSPAQQGMATLGPATFRPAEPGKLAKGYLGRPVYDNWAILEVPVTISPQAIVGRKQPVSLEMKFDLYDGVSAQAIGRFIDHAAAEIEIGLSPDPNVVVRPRTGAQPQEAGEAAAQPGVGPTDAERGSKPALPERKVEVAETQAPKVQAPLTAAPAAGVPEPAAPTPLIEDDGFPGLPLWIGGGALLLVVLLLLVRRR